MHWQHWSGQKRKRKKNIMCQVVLSDLFTYWLCLHNVYEPVLSFVDLLSLVLSKEVQSSVMDMLAKIGYSSLSDSMVLL